MTNKERYDTLKAAGLCVQCGKCQIELHYSTTKCTLCLANARTRQQKYRQKQPKSVKRVTAKTKLWYSSLRHEVVMAYGGVCNCCQEQEIKFLELDHVNNDGNVHRALCSNIYTWAKKNNFPDTLQLLCSNCNHGKHRNNGVCPHVTKRMLDKENSDAVTRWKSNPFLARKLRRVAPDFRW